MVPEEANVPGTSSGVGDPHASVPGARRLSRATAIGDAVAAVLLAAVLSSLGQDIAYTIWFYQSVDSPTAQRPGTVPSPAWSAVFSGAGWPGVVGVLLVLAALGAVVVPRWLEGELGPQNFPPRALVLTGAVALYGAVAIVSGILGVISSLEIGSPDGPGYVLPGLLGGSLLVVLAIWALGICSSSAQSFGEDAREDGGRHIEERLESELDKEGEGAVSFIGDLMCAVLLAVFLAQLGGGIANLVTGTQGRSLWAAVEDLYNYLGFWSSLIALVGTATLAAPRWFFGQPAEEVPTRARALMATVVVAAGASTLEGGLWLVAMAEGNDHYAQTGNVVEGLLVGGAALLLGLFSLRNWRLPQEQMPGEDIDELTVRWRLAGGGPEGPSPWVPPES